jgi:hypothetical protein
MNDIYDVVTGKEDLVVCPECGNYDDTEYHTFTDEHDDLDEVGASRCAICERWFV